MPDYKEMYLTLFRASTEALELLITAQQKCEDLFISAPTPEITIIPSPKEQGKNADGE
ncbi:MAG: hypothetical protein HDT38_00635 [Clostridiales bacterium]|nr:hypothetical protein [Clostridiales bacterium]